VESTGARSEKETERENARLAAFMTGATNAHGKQASEFVGWRPMISAGVHDPRADDAELSFYNSAIGYRAWTVKNASLRSCGPAKLRINAFKTFCLIGS
jgi:hypothetical protein